MVFDAPGLSTIDSTPFCRDSRKVGAEHPSAVHRLPAYQPMPCNTRSARSCIAILSAFSLTTCTVSAQVPTTDRIEIRSFAPGGTAHLVAHGKGFKNVKHLWTPVGNIPFKPEGDKPSETVAHFEGPVAADVVPGVTETRVITAQGVSARRYLVIDDLPAFAPPDSCELNPPKTVLPGACSLNGYVNALKPKFFGIALKKDQTVSIEVFARRLDSPLDPVLRFLSATGRELAFADDTSGLSGDAQLNVTAPETGTYTLELRDVQYSGGGGHYYHLRIGAFPLVQGTFPRRTAAGGAVQLVSESSGDVPATVTANAVQLAAAVSVKTPHGSSLGTLATANSAPFMETEPNDSRETGTPIAADTVGIAGRFQTKGDVDWFKLTAADKQHLCITTHTRDVGSPSDVVLEVWGADGKKLQESDDVGSSDAQLSVGLPAAGDYFVKVRELSGQGGASWTYDLEVQRSGRIEVTTAVDTVAVPKNGTVSIPVSVKRMGMTAPFKITATELPPGIVATPVIASEKQKTAFVTLHATAEAADSFQHPIRIVATPAANAAPIPVLYAPTPPKGVSYVLPRIQTGVFAHSAGAAAYSLTSDPAAVKLASGSETKITIRAARTGDWKQPIDVASAVPAAELPTGITVAAAKIEKDSVEVTIKADDKAQPGHYTLSLQGTLKKDKTTIVQPVPTIALEVTAPPTTAGG